MLAVVGGSVAFGQTAITEQSIALRLKQGPFVLLRGMYAGDKLNFDADGNLIGSARTLPFSLSAVVIEKVKLGDTELTIEGEHAALEFEPMNGRGEPSRTKVVPFGRKLHPGVTITVERNPAHPDGLDAALERIFSVGFDESLVDSAPEFWRPWLRHKLDPAAPVDAAPPGIEKIDPKAGVSAPVLRYDPDPQYSEVAREAHVDGMCVVGLVIDAQGKPQQSWIVKPVGDGLDEEAIAVVNQYRFKPAMKHGQPVPVRVNIEVNFRN